MDLSTGKPEPFLKTPLNEGSAAISPDGRWLAYDSNEKGEYEVFVRPFPGPGGKWRVSTGGGLVPAWSRKERELFYLGPEGIMAAGYSADAGNFDAGRPRLWTGCKGIRAFAVAPDGKRAAILEDESSGKAEISQVVLLSGFLDHPRSLVPARGK
jgi:eukaryotic-like serine/threonine-protein kinase